MIETIVDDLEGFNVDKIPVLVKAEDVPAVTKTPLFISGRMLLKNNI